MVALDISADELQSGKLTAEHLRKASHALQTDGFVVLKDVVSKTSIETLRDKMLEDVERILARKDTPFNFNTANIQQEAPPFPPYLFRDVLMNDLVIEVTQAILGPGLKNAYYSGNTTVPGSKQKQPTHPDVAQLWPHLPQATPAFGFVVNVPVVDATPENGSTEIWPGTHLDTTMCIQQGDIKVPEEALAKWREKSPPIQPTISAGSVLIRDIRLWHNGMPNLTDTPRPMIAMIHWVGWWNNEDKVVFPKGTEEFFKHPVLHTNARFVEPSEIDYIHHSSAYDFKGESDATPST